MIPDMTIGQYALPAILMVIMGLIYYFVPVIEDRWKALLTILITVGLAIVSMFYDAPEVVTFRMWINTIIGGIFVGASAIGLYEAQRTIRKPRA